MKIRSNWDLAAVLAVGIFIALLILGVLINWG